VNDNVNHADFLFLDSTRSPITGEPLMEDDDDTPMVETSTDEIGQPNPNTLNDEPPPDQPEQPTNPQQEDITPEQEQPASQADEDDDASTYPGETPIMEEFSDEDLSDIYNQFQVEDDSDYIMTFPDCLGIAHGSRK
jgi:hypothetical protein